MLNLTERPKVLSEMVGQFQILNEMKRRSKSIDFPTYMIFEGETGSGKSTLAFIIAKLLNCQNTKEGNPCNECAACLDVVEEKFRRDIYYMDASHMGKDEVIALQQKLNNMPMYDQNKVIIIDEAHLLNSPAARGAMLTLTEKSRKNIYFILCTTDLSKFDKALKSRFQCYTFRKVKTAEIGEVLFDIIEKNELEVPDQFIEEGLLLIAEYADGSVREAIQYLDRCIYGQLFSKEDIEKELGFISQEKLKVMLRALLKGHSQFLIEYENLEDKEKFFYYSLKILLNAKKYSWTLNEKEKWKKDFYEELNKYTKNDIDSVLKVYTNFLENSKNYFDKNLFLSYLLRDLLFSGGRKEKIEKRERVPV
jgi:DNA polymerase-3 subunit gamma/tau